MYAENDENRLLITLTPKGHTAIQDGPKSNPLQIYINKSLHMQEKHCSVILHIHQLRNDSILYQVVCAASSVKYSMVLSSRNVSVVYPYRKV